MTMSPKMEVITLEESNPVIAYKLPGELKANQKVDIYAKVPSYLLELKCDIGSKVRKGEVIVRLDAPEINSNRATAYANLKAKEATYISTEATYQRILKANETEGAISQDRLDQISAKRDADQAMLEAAKASFNEVKAIESYLTIHAPFDGVISARNYDVGAYVGPAGKGSHLPLLTIQQEDKLRLTLAIPEAQTPYVNAKDTVSFVVKSAPQALFKGVVVRKAGALDAKLRAEFIEVDIDNRAGLLLPGMVVDATLGLKGQGATFFIPKSAIVDSNLGIYVMKIIEGKTKKIVVRKGRINGMMIEVFGDLKAGDQILKVVGEETKEGVSIQ